jgi:uncharacterized protein (TIGR04255 family)
VKPFSTPLFRTVTELNFALQPVVEFRARSLYESLKGSCPIVQQFPVFFVPPDQLTPEQKQQTPAIYQFASQENERAVLVGPRVLTAAVREWTGYPEYRRFVERVVNAHLPLLIDPIVERHSLGFYNRIPVSGLEELREILASSVPVESDASLFDLVLQSSRQTEIGSLLSQIIVARGDAETPEPFLAINNIFHSSLVTGGAFSIARFLEWLDAAHELGRNAIWGQLSESVKAAWAATSA